MLIDAQKNNHQHIETEREQEPEQQEQQQEEQSTYYQKPYWPVITKVKPRN